MTTLGGFDPSRSLLPDGGGVIHAMSGGGMDTSLLPQAAGHIHVMTGGEVINPVANPNVQAEPHTSSSQIISSALSDPLSSQGVSNVQTTSTISSPPSGQNISGVNISTDVPLNPLTTTPLSELEPPSKAISVVSQTVPPEQNIEEDEEKHIGLPSQSIPQRNPSEVKKNNAPVTNKPKRIPEAPLSEDEARVTLFGKRLVLKRPKNNSTTFDKEQQDIIHQFGLDYATPDMKRSVLRALYDGSCDTNRSLITMRSCEPFRQIVRSLALRYLNKMNGEVMEEDATYEMEEKEEKKGEDDEKAMTFSPNRGKQSEMEEKLASMEDDRITILGIPNPSPSVSCYCNSTVQLLYSIPEVRTAILSYSCQTPLTAESMKEEKENKEGVVCALQDVFRSLSKQTDKIQSYQAPSNGSNEVISGEDAEKVQYIMRQFNIHKGSKADVTHDANELILYLLNDVFETIETIKSIVSYFTVGDTKIMYHPSASSGNVIEDKPAQPTIQKVITLSYDELISLIQSNPSNFEEEKKAFDVADSSTISVTSLIRAHEYSRNSEEAVGGTEKYEIEPTPTNRYLLFDLSKTEQQQTITLDVSPRIVVKGKNYVFLGSVLYTSRNEGHYTYHLVDSSHIRQQGDKPVLEGVHYVNYSDGQIMTGTKESDVSQYPLSEQARLLVYRSEDAMDEWKAEIEKQRQSASIGKPLVEELPPQQLPAELVAKMDVIRAMTLDEVLQEYEPQKQEITTQLDELKRAIEEAKPQIQSYLDRYKTEPSSAEQQSEYATIEKLVQNIVIQSSIVQQKQFDLSNNLASKRVELTGEKVNVGAIITGIPYEQYRDRKELQKIYNESDEILDKILEGILEKKKEVQEMETDFRGHIQKDVGELIRSIKGDVSNQPDEAYRAEFIGQSIIKTGQEFYDEMVASQAYLDIQSEINDRFKQIGELKTEIDSISSRIFSSSEEKHQSEEGSAQPIENPTGQQENLPPITINLSDPSATSSSSQNNPNVGQVNSPSSRTLSDPSSTTQQEQLVNPTVEQVNNPSSSTSSSQSSIEIPTDPSVTIQSGSTSSGNQPMSGGASSDELVSYLQKQMTVYDELNHLLSSILNKKRIYIESYELEHLQTPYAELFMKSTTDEEKNESSDMTPITKMRRNMIRMDILHSIQTALKDFWTLVYQENDTEHASADTINEEIRTSYHQFLNQPPADTTNAFYLYLLKESAIEPEERLKDIRVDVIQLFTTDEEKMIELTKNPFDLSQVDTALNELNDLIQQYNTIIDSKQQYEQLPSLRTQIQQHIVGVNKQLSERLNSIPSDKTIAPSLLVPIQHLLNAYQQSKTLFLQKYETFHKKSLFTYIGKEIQIVSDEEHTRTEQLLNNISHTLQEWYDFFNTRYDPSYQTYTKWSENAHLRILDKYARLQSITKGIKSYGSNVTDLPENYATTYKAQLLGNQAGLLSLEQKEEAIPTSNQTKEIVDVVQEVDDGIAELGQLKEEFYQDPTIVSTSYDEKVKEVLSKYDIVKDRLTLLIKNLVDRKTEMEEEEKKLEGYKEQVNEQVAKDAATNKDRSMLEASTATSLAQVIEEVRVRQEVEEEFRKKIEELQNKRQLIDMQLAAERDELLEMTMKQALLTQEYDMISQQVALRQTLKQKQEENRLQQEELRLQQEELQAQIDSARKEVKLKKKIDQVQAAIDGLIKMKQYVPDENYQPIDAFIEKKRTKLRTLEQLMAEQVQGRGSLPLTNERIQNTTTYPLKNVQNNAPEEVKENVPSAITDSYMVRSYMSTTYNVTLTPPQTKELIRKVKELKGPSITIRQIIDANDFFSLLYKAARLTGIDISPDKNPYQSYIVAIHTEYEQDQTMDLYQTIMSKQSNVEDIYIPDRQSDYIRAILDSFTRVNDDLRSILGSDDFKEVLSDYMDAFQEEIDVNKITQFMNLAQGAKAGDITQDEYIAYRKYLELLYSLIEPPLRDDLITFYTRLHDEEKERKEQEEHDRVAREAEEERKRQEEEEKRQRLQKEHYDQTRSTIKALLRDMRSHLRFIQKTKGLPPQMKDLSVDLKELDKMIQTYSKQYKNAQDKSASLWTSLMPTKIQTALDHLRTTYLDSNQSVVLKPEYSMIAKTINELSSSHQEIVEYIRETKNQNRANNNRNYTTFLEEQQAEEERIAREEKEEEEKRQLEEKQAEESRLTAVKAEKNRIAAEEAAKQAEEEQQRAEQKRIKNEKAAANLLRVQQEREKQIARRREEHKKEIGELKAQIDVLENKLDAIRKSEEAFSTANPKGMVPHLKRLIGKELSRTFKARPEKITKTNMFQIDGYITKFNNPKEKPTKANIGHALKLYQQYLTPEKEAMRQEKAKLQEQIERLEQGDEKQNVADTSTVASSSIQLNLEVNTQALLQKRKEIAKRVQLIKDIQSLKLKLNPSQPIQPDTVAYLAHQMKEYGYFNNDRVFIQQNSKNHKKLSEYIDNFLLKLTEQIEELQQTQEELQNSIRKKEQMISSNPRHRIQNDIQAIMLLKNILTVDNIAQSVEEIKRIMSYYSTNAEPFTNRLTKIATSKNIVNTDKVPQLQTVIQEFIQYLTKEYSELSTKKKGGVRKTTQARKKKRLRTRKVKK